jgi:RNA polymerase sigma factor (sigma-70 family)
MDDAARFRALFEATFGAVRRYVGHRGVTGGRADDIVAETFVVAWRRLDDVPPDRPLPWLLTVARNIWLNQRRGDRRYEALRQRLPLPVPVPAPAEPVDLAAVRQALAALDAADREIICLVGWDGLSAAEVGEVLGCSPGAARGRLHRARQRLAANLAERAGGNGHDRGEDQLTGRCSDDRA